MAAAFSEIFFSSLAGLRLRQKTFQECPSASDWREALDLMEHVETIYSAVQGLSPLLRIKK